MKVAITGGTGLVGKALHASLVADGHEVLVISRSQQDGYVHWDPARGEIDTAALTGIEAVVNLAGRSVASRWTSKVKREIRESRVLGTQLIAGTMTKLRPTPGVLINASAIGFYGTQRKHDLIEESTPGNGFLADVTRDWEAATQAAEDVGIRTVHLRIGVVLSAEGGALEKLLTPFRLGLGGPVGDGRMVMSWIAIDDLVALIRFLLDNAAVYGPVNATAPEPVTNAEFTKALADVLGRPAVVPAPALALKAAFGEMAKETLLSSLRVLPRRAEEAGFSFQYPDLRGALKHLLS